MGLDRDRAFYPTVMIVIALYYVLFAVMSGSIQTILAESAAMIVFAAAAVAGFKSNAWIVAAALAAHGGFDAVHGYLIENAACRRGGRHGASPTTWGRPRVSPGSCDAGI